VVNRTVDVIIVASNSEEVIGPCLETLQSAAGDCVLRVTVVDNASAADISPYIAGTGVPVTVLRRPKNLGYAAGNNAAIRAILDSSNPEPSAILILNPDVRLSPRSIERLLRFLNETPSCGAISPTTPQRGHATRSLWGWPIAQPRGDGSLARTDRLPGFCMLVRPEVFRRVGLFDETYFLYWEEVDFCLRARKAGFDLLIARFVPVTHGAEKETRPKTHRTYYMWRNQFPFAMKNFGRIEGMVFLARRLLVANLLEILRSLVRGEFRHIGCGFAGLAAGFRQESGPSPSRFAAVDLGPLSRLRERRPV